jgi:hypothetical protein
MAKVKATTSPLCGSENSHKIKIYQQDAEIK